MKQNRPYPAVTVSAKAERSLRAGHPWVYADEIRSTQGELTAGGITDVFTLKGSWLGAGIYSAASKIAVRVLTDNANETFSDAFFERRVKYALEYRRITMGADFNACRLIFGEADGLPGVTVDRFEDVLVTQILSYGMEVRKDILYRALVTQLAELGVGIRGVYERSESPLRAKEGLEPCSGWYEGLPHSGGTSVVISENGVKYTVDFENGQKTGFFLDQKYNRLAVARLAPGKRVLDCFTHTGSFALNCALAGAEHVTAVDVSESAVSLARENARLNGLDGRMDFLAADVFDLLPKLLEERALRHRHTRPARIYQVPPHGEKRRARLQGDKLPGHAAAAARRISRHGLVLALHGKRALCEDAALRRPRRQCEAPRGRGPQAGPGSSNPLECP